MDHKVHTSPVTPSHASHFQSRLENEDNVSWDDQNHVTFNSTADDPVPVTGKVEGGQVSGLEYQDQIGQYQEMFFNNSQMGRYGDKRLLADATQNVGKLNNVLYRKNYDRVIAASPRILKDYFNQFLRVSLDPHVRHQLLGEQLSGSSGLLIKAAETDSHGWLSLEIPTMHGVRYITLCQDEV